MLATFAIGLAPTVMDRAATTVFGSEAMAGAVAADVASGLAVVSGTLIAAFALVLALGELVLRGGR